MRTLRFLLRATCSAVAVLSFVAGVTGRADADASDSIFAADWEVAKGVERVALPPAPAKDDDARSVVKVWIGQDGSVVRSEFQSGDGDLAKLVESALARWHYHKFDFGGRAVEVQTYVSVVYEHLDHRYYVQGDGRVLYGPPNTVLLVAGLQDDETGLTGYVKADVSPDPKRRGKRDPVPVGVIAGRVLTRKNPPFPDAAKRAGAEGDVTVSVVVGKSGLVLYVAPVDGHRLLQPVTVAAAHEWTFTPTIFAGAPALVTGTITFHFHR